MTDTGQLVMSGMLPDTYWVTIKDHEIIPVGTRFLVVGVQYKKWLLCWRDGVKPPHRILGSLLHVDQVQVEENQDDAIVETSTQGT